MDYIHDPITLLHIDKVTALSANKDQKATNIEFYIVTLSITHKGLFNPFGTVTAYVRAKIGRIL